VPSGLEYLIPARPDLWQYDSDVHVDVLPVA